MSTVPTRPVRFIIHRFRQARIRPKVPPRPPPAPAGRDPRTRYPTDDAAP